MLLNKEAVAYYESVSDFVVAEVDGRVVGCGALHVLWEDLGEVRTLAVDASVLGTASGPRCSSGSPRGPSASA